MISIILLIISLFLDGIFSILIPINSLFLPLLSITTIYIIFPQFKKNKKLYYILSFITGIIYDLLYTNLLFFNGIIFLIIALITRYIYTTYQQTNLKKIIYLIILITLYEIINATILFIFQITVITIYKIQYKIIHSILLNIIYAFFINQLINKKA